MKKKLIIGAIFGGFLLILVPSIPAVNYTTVKKTYQEKIERTIKEDFLSKTSWKIHPLALVLAAILFFVFLLPLMTIKLLIYAI